MIQDISTPWKFWTHISAGFDTLTGDIALSMDGRPTVMNNFEKLRNGKPINLDQKLEIGLTDTDNAYGGRRSFRGEISNIQFHVFEETMSREILSKNLVIQKDTMLLGLAWFSRPTGTMCTN